MVALNIVEESNARIKHVPSELVAVFVGATNGVGETTVRQFAKYATRPRAYIIGRSKEAGNRIPRLSSFNATPASCATSMRFVMRSERRRKW